MTYPILIRKNPGGSAAYHALDVADALLKTWDIDAHIVQYEGSVRRNKDSVSADDPLYITLELYDFDLKDAPEGWAEDCLAKLPEGFIGYRTAGGFRALTLREQPFVVGNAEQWEDWRVYHGGRAEALGAWIDAEPDHATDEPNRLFRLPLAKREDGKPSFRQLYGEIGYADLAPAPYERRPATECTEGDPDDMLVSRVLSAAKLDECPWQLEHTDKLGGGMVIFPTDDGLGKFHCAHSHCKGRGTPEVIEALKGLPAVRVLLEDWGLHETETAVPKAAEPSGWLSWAEIMAPLPPLEWLCADLQLAPGRPGAIVAAPNIGKTWCLQAMAMSVAAGVDIFGQFPVLTPGPVLHVSTDAGDYATRWRYQLLAKGMQLEARDLPICVWPGRVRCVTKHGDFDPKGLQPIVDKAAQIGAKLVILDSLFSIAAGLDMMAPDAASPLWMTKNLPGVWLWAMHTPKNAKGFFGSNAIGAACGVMWDIVLDGDDKKKPRLWSISRKAEEYQGESLDSFATDWKREYNEANVLVSGRIDYVPPSDVKTLNPALEIKARVLAALDAGALNQSQLKVALSGIKMRWEDKLVILQAIVDSKAVVCNKNGRQMTYARGDRFGN